MRRLGKRLEQHGSRCIARKTVSTRRYHVTQHGESDYSAQKVPATHSVLQTESTQLPRRIEDSQVGRIQDFENIIMYEPLQRKFVGPYKGENKVAEDRRESHIATDFQAESVTAYVAIGSNLGKRMRWIERALRELKLRGVVIKRTSSLWETEPMYVTDQERFLNGVIEIETKLRPEPLLRLLQDVENILGRHKILDKGPRNIDLDILLYDDITYDSKILTIPHALMLDRDFVLRPLAEFVYKPITPTTLTDLTRLIPNVRGFYPNRTETVLDFLSALPKSESPMYPVIHLGGQSRPRNMTDPKRKTRIMAILNTTPDSFSDGGKFFTSISNDSSPPPSNSTSGQKRSDVASDSISKRHNTFDRHVKKFIRELHSPGRPQSIIDVGGQSTAPNTPEVPSTEEIARIVPAIRAIASSPIKPLISIDTYRASVAQAAINAGAHIVNDVSAGTLDPEILKVVADAGCPYILMHMRGTPATMSKLTTYPEGLIPTIAKELLGRISAAEEAGIYRWRIILDPGIGFAKTASQNLEILRNFEQLRNYPGLENFAWLVGSSRKGFIGKVTGEEQPDRRGVGSMVAVAAAIQGGADIVRIHDLKMGLRAVKMADAVWRGWNPRDENTEESEESDEQIADGKEI